MVGIFESARIRVNVAVTVAIGADVEVDTKAVISPSRTRYPSLGRGGKMALEKLLLGFTATQRLRLWPIVGRIQRSSQDCRKSL